MEIRSVCSGTKHVLRVNVESSTDVICNLRCSGCSQAQNSLCFDFFREPGDCSEYWSIPYGKIASHAMGSHTFQIIRPKGMTPLGDAMSFVDGK